MRLAFLVIALWVQFSNEVVATESYLFSPDDRICLSSNFALVGIHQETHYARQMSYSLSDELLGDSELNDVAISRDISSVSESNVMSMRETARKIRNWLTTGQGETALDWEDPYTASHFMTVINSNNSNRVVSLLEENVTLEPMQVGLAISFGANIEVVESLLEITSNYTSSWFDSTSGHEDTILTAAFDESSRDVFEYLYKRLGGFTEQEVDFLRLMVFKELMSNNSGGKIELLRSLGLTKVLDTPLNTATGTHFLDLAEARVREQTMLIESWPNVVIVANSSCQSTRTFLDISLLSELKQNKGNSIDDVTTLLRMKSIPEEDINSLSRAYFELINLKSSNTRGISKHEQDLLYSFYDLIGKKDWQRIKNEYTHLPPEDEHLKPSILATLSTSDFPPADFDVLFKEQVMLDSSFLFTLYELGRVKLILRILGSSSLPMIYDSNYKSSLYHFLNGGGDVSLVKYFEVNNPHENNRGINFENLMAGFN